MWTKYLVRFEFLNKLCAGIPADPDTIKKVLESRRPAVRPPESRSIDEIAAEVISSLGEIPEEAEEGEPTLHVFQRQPAGFVVRAGTLRAHIKDCVQTLSTFYVGRVAKEKSFAVRAKAALYTPPEASWFPILDREGRPITEPSGIATKPIHFMTRSGPRSAIKYYEYIEGAVIDWKLWVMTAPSDKLVVGEADLKSIFTYGAVHGYGPERGDGEGRYAFTLTRMMED
jgi:hypothetical protein